MASVNGVSSSNLTSSLYNSSHVISGLASGMDTESMIEGLVQSYQTKIQTLSNKATKLEWKQEAYRSIISKMNAFSNKYTSYTSGTNLMSASFFSGAVKVAAQGKYANKVSASGRTDSDVRLNSVSQLATAARYTTSSNLDIGSDFAISASEGVRFDDTVEMGTLSGSLSLNYGGKTVSVIFDANTDMIKNNLSAGEKGQALADMIRDKLSDTKITLSNGESRDASDLIDVKADSSGNITFADKTTGGNSVYMSDASDTVKTVLGLNLDNASKDKPDTIQVRASTPLTQTPSVADLISGQTMNVSLDGKTKTIYMPKVTKNDDGTYTLSEASASKDKEGNTVVSYRNPKTVSATEYADTYAGMLQDAISKEFGSKIKVENLGSEITNYDGNVIGKELKLSIQAPENSSMIINTDAGNALGIGNTATNYLNTGKTLGEVGSKIDWSKMTKATDENGNVLKDKKGNDLYEFVINGKKVGSYNQDSKLSDLMSDINSSDAGVKVNYSQTTRTFTFTSKDTGEENEIAIGGAGRTAENDLAKAIFGSTQVVDKDKMGDAKMRDVMGVSSLRGEQIKLKVGDTEIDYTISGSNPTVKNVIDAVNGKLRSEGSDVRASLSDDGSIVFKDADGKVQNVTADNDFTQKMVDGVAKSANKYMGDSATYTKGKDAIFQVEVNGQTLDMTRASNSANIDGLTLNFKGTFGPEDEDYEAVTFQSSTDSDKIVDAVKSMIADYNSMMSEIRNQYATLPYQSSNGTFKSYEPLTDEDRASMSESAIQNYEAKAKQGLLFNDRNLSTLYDRMRSVFAPGGADEATLRRIGITMDYSTSDGTSIVLDESKLREALDSDPDAVADIFTRSVDSGASSNGIMQNMKVQLDRYAGITGATKGILVQQAGTPLSSLTLMSNNWQSQIDSINNDIEKWQDKLSTQVDKYTSMFSKLETLIAQMNSQSSTLASMMGGSSY